MKPDFSKATPGPLVFEIVPDNAAERAGPKSEWTGLYIGPESDEPPGRILRTIFEGGFTHGPEDGDPEIDAAKLVYGFNNIEARDALIAELVEGLELAETAIDSSLAMVETANGPPSWDFLRTARTCARRLIAKVKDAGNA